MKRFLRRRAFERAGLAASLGWLAGCPREGIEPAVEAPIPCTRATGAGDADFVVIGSGAGGGPLACNLARAGYRVTLLEAGGDPESTNRQVPALHPAASEDPALCWDFFVRTYANAEEQARNPRYVPDKGGVLYPRGGTLGGSTALNALVTIYPHESDWNAIASALKDESWRAANMRKYFERLERCGYAKPSGKPGNPSRHGYEGWLHTEIAELWLGLGDGVLSRIIEGAVEDAAERNPMLLADAVKMVLDPGQSLWDPNDDRVCKAASEGVFFIPMHVKNGARHGTREYIRATEAACSGGLTVVLGALATRVLFDEERRAIGVEYLEGANLYRASRDPDPSAQPEKRTIRAAREVILCGGVFNSPQLLMLSGVGPRDQLSLTGVDAVSVLEGVGKNLQDRYELGVVNRLVDDLDVLEGADIRAPSAGSPPDPAFERWQRHRKGPYSTNGIVCGRIMRSSPKLSIPDLFLFGLVGNFHGYYPGYAAALTADKRHFTWGILKAHTHNRAGTVRLRSSDPRDPPDIDFNVFDRDSGGAEEDIEAVTEGVITARRMMRWLGDKVEDEIIPGPGVLTRPELADFIRHNAWGHHASCTNKMGPAEDPLAVVDGRFRVHGVKNLRVVDASVFPRIPGFFIVSAVYMLAEKATDAILEDARAVADG